MKRNDKMNFTLKPQISGLEGKNQMLFCYNVLPACWSCFYCYNSVPSLQYVSMLYRDYSQAKTLQLELCLRKKKKKQWKLLILSGHFFPSNFTMWSDLFLKRKVRHSCFPALCYRLTINCHSLCWSFCTTTFLKKFNFSS